MDGFRFYLEHESPRHKRRGDHSGNVFAAFGPNYHDGRGAMREGIGSVFSHADSGVCTTSASLDWLATHCKRISEAKAREIHPALFQVLDAPDD